METLVTAVVPEALKGAGAVVARSFSSSNRSP